MSIPVRIKTSTDDQVFPNPSSIDQTERISEECKPSTDALKELNTKLVSEISLLREALEAVKAPAKVKNLYQQLFKKKKQLIRAKETIVNLENRNEILIDENNKLNAKTIESKLEDYAKEIEPLSEENKDLRKELMKRTAQCMNEVDRSLKDSIAGGELETLYLSETDAIIDEFEKDYRELKEKYSKLLQDMENVNAKNSDLLEEIRKEEEKSNIVQKKYSNLLQEVEDKGFSSQQRYLELKDECMKLAADLEVLSNQKLKMSQTCSNWEDHRKLFSSLIQEIKQIATKYRHISMPEKGEPAQLRENDISELLKSISELKTANEGLISKNLESATQAETNDIIVRNLEERLSEMKSKYNNLYMEMEIISQDNERLNTSLSVQNDNLENGDVGGNDIQCHDNHTNELYDEIVKINSELLECKQYRGKLQEDVTQLRSEMELKDEKVESLLLFQWENLQLQAECKSISRKYEELKKVIEETPVILNGDGWTSADEYQRLKQEYNELFEMYQTSTEEILKIKANIRWYELQLSKKKKFLAQQSQELQHTLVDLKSLESFIIKDTKTLGQNSIIEDIIDNEIQEVVEERNIMIKNEYQVNTEREPIQLQCLSTTEDIENNPPDSPTFIRLFLKKNGEVRQEEEEGGDSMGNAVFELGATQQKEEIENGCHESDTKTQLQEGDERILQSKHETDKEQAHNAILNGCLESEKDYMKSLKEMKEDFDHLGEILKRKEELINDLVTRQQQYEKQIVENNDKIEYFKNELKHSLHRIDHLKSTGQSGEMEQTPAEEKYMSRMGAKNQELKNLQEKLKELDETRGASVNDETTANTLGDLLEKFNEIETINKELKTERENLKENLQQNLEVIQHNEEMRIQHEKQKKDLEKHIHDLTQKIINLEENEARATKNLSIVEKELLAITEQVQKFITDKEEMSQNQELNSDLQIEIKTLTGKLAEGKRRHQSEMEYLQLVLENRSEEVDSLRQTIREKNNLIKTMKKENRDYEEVITTQMREINRNAIEKEEMKIDFAALLKKYESLKALTDADKRNPIRESEIAVKTNRIVQFNDATVLNRYSFVDLPSPVDGSDFDYLQLYSKFEESCKEVEPVSMASSNDKIESSLTFHSENEQLHSEIFSFDKSTVAVMPPAGKSPFQLKSSCADLKNEVDVYKIEFETDDDKDYGHHITNTKQDTVAYIVTGYNQERKSFNMPNQTPKHICDGKLLTDKEILGNQKIHIFVLLSKCDAMKKKLYIQNLVLNKKDRLLEESKETIDRISAVMEAQRGLSLCVEKRLCNFQSEIDEYLKQIQSQEQFIQELGQKLQSKQRTIEGLESAIDVLKAASNRSKNILINEKSTSYGSRYELRSEWRNTAIIELEANLHNTSCFQCRCEEIFQLQTINMKLREDQKILVSKVNFLASWNRTFPITSHSSRKKELFQKDRINLLLQDNEERAVSVQRERKLETVHHTSKCTPKGFLNKITEGKGDDDLQSPSKYTASYLIRVLKAERDTLCRTVTRESRLNSILTMKLLKSEKELQAQQTDLQDGSLDDQNVPSRQDFRLLVRDLEIKRLRELIETKYREKMATRRRKWIGRGRKKQPKIVFENRYENESKSIVFKPL